MFTKSICHSSVQFALLVAAFLFYGASASAAEFHARPATDCAYNGDGSTATCAASNGTPGAFRGFSSVNWTAIQPGDTLFIVGKHENGLVIQKSGTASQRIIFRGDKPGVARGSIDGVGTVSLCIYDNNNRYLSFLNLEVSNCLNRGFQFDNGRGVNTVNPSGVVINNVYVHDIVGGSIYPTCIWGYGHDVLIENSRIEDCGDDGIWWVGSQAKVINNWISGVGIGPEETGDCVQLAGGSTEFLIKRNHCDHTAANEKQCFNSATPGHVYDPSAGGLMVENTCILPRYDGHSTEGLAADQPLAIVARNFVTGGRYGIFTKSGYVIANVVTQFSERGIQVFGYPGLETLVANNTVLARQGENGQLTPGFCIFGYDTSGEFFNNIVSGCNVGMAAYGPTQNNNLWDNNLSWQNNTDFQFGNGTNTTSNTIGSNPGFLGGDPNSPFSWSVSVAIPGRDVSAHNHPVYGTIPFLLDYNKALRPNEPSVGAFEPGSE